MHGVLCVDWNLHGVLCWCWICEWPLLVVHDRLLQQWHDLVQIVFHWQHWLYDMHLAVWDLHCLFCWLRPLWRRLHSMRCWHDLVRHYCLPILCCTVIHDDNWIEFMHSLLDDFQLH